MCPHFCRVGDLEAENVGLKTTLRKKDKEKVQVEKKVEELIRSAAVVDNNGLRTERAVSEANVCAHGSWMRVYSKCCALSSAHHPKRPSVHIL